MERGGMSHGHYYDLWRVHWFKYIFLLNKINNANLYNASDMYLFNILWDNFYIILVYS